MKPPRGDNGVPSPGRRDGLIAFAVGLAAFGLYLRTLAPGLLFGDAGEVQFAVPTLGLLHPTGYPLFTLVGWLWAHLLPVGDMAWRMNAFSALWGGVAVGLTYVVAWWAIGLSTPLSGWPQRLGAVATAFLFATSPTFWSQAIIAEVYTLHLVFVALLFWLAFRIGNGGDVGRWSVLALVFGLSLTHHRTTLLLLPPVAIYLWPPHRGRGLRPQVGQATLLTIAPLLLYTYILWRGEQSSYLHIRLAPDQVIHIYQPTWFGFLTWALGTGFVGALRSPAAALAHLPGAGRSLWAEFGPLLALPTLTIILWMVQRRWRLLVCTGLFCLEQLAFNLFYGIGDVFVMYIPLYFITAVWAGSGLAMLLVWSSRQQPLRGWRFLAGLVLVGALGFLLLRGLRTLPHVDRSRDTQARDTWEKVLATDLPPDAILLSNDRDEMTPLFYLQLVERRATGLTGLFPLITDDAAWRDIGTSIEAALMTGRPVYLIKAMPGLEVKFDLQAGGGLTQVVGMAPTAHPQQPTGLVFGDAVRLAGYDVRWEADAVQVTLYWQVIVPLSDNYTTFVQLLAEGEKVAQSDHRPGGDYYPTTLWKPGETLRDVHRLWLPQGTEPAAYRLLVGVYRYPSLQHVGEPAVVGVIHYQNQERMDDDG